jgi:hypothetical protein
MKFMLQKVQVSDYAFSKVLYVKFIFALSSDCIEPDYGLDDRNSIPGRGFFL